MYERSMNERNIIEGNKVVDNHFDSQVYGMTDMHPWHPYSALGLACSLRPINCFPSSSSSSDIDLD